MEDTCEFLSNYGIPIKSDIFIVSQLHIYEHLNKQYKHGMDCYRTWEALLLGCIVIVKTSPLDCLYTDLPVVILNNWTDLTQELLIKTASEFTEKTYNYDKLTLDYWMKQIQNHQRAI